MSQENVEIVEASFEAWNAADMDALRDVLDPDAVMRAPEGWPEPGPFFGREAVMRQVEQLRETWDSDSFELISDFIDVGDRVAVRFIWHGTGHGPESNFELTSINTVRKAKIIDIAYFWDHAAALEAVGLSEQDVAQ
jgi:ketosteroid isomerase-like protein